MSMLNWFKFVEFIILKGISFKPFNSFMLKAGL